MLEGIKTNKLDVIATDHAPHLLSEKEGFCLSAASGGPLIQHSLLAMLEMSRCGKLSKEMVIEKMCHSPAQLFNINKRGFIREGYYADLVLIDPNASYFVEKENLLYKCEWSPFEGTEFHAKIDKTFVNGNLVYDKGKIQEGSLGKLLEFNA